MIQTVKAAVQSIIGGKQSGPRPDRCSCGYPEPRGPFPKRAVKQREFKRLYRVEETDAAEIEHYQMVQEFRCTDCGETFEWTPSFATTEETTFKEDNDAK